RHPRVDRYVVLDLHAIADPHARVDEHVLREYAVATDDGSFTDVRVVPHAGALTDQRARLDDRRLLYEHPQTVASGPSPPALRIPMAVGRPDSGTARRTTTRSRSARESW